jgi:pimeloyl-ACP methyl ester carboxylesterase
MYFVETKSRAIPLRAGASKAVAVAAGVVAVGAAAAVLNHWLGRRAERRNPPLGQFMTVKGVRLHYVDRGTGAALVLLHGNGSMVEDFQSSGLLDQAARKYRVLAFDRPGFGHSSRPRDRSWTPAAQADLIAAALAEIGISSAMVLGHSWGNLVAVALALRHPRLVRSLILVSGYYFPTARTDVVVSAPAAAPVLGDVLSYTLSPLLSRLMWPGILRKLFGPSPVPGKFAQFPEEMVVRPWQLRAAASEVALLVPAARAFQNRYQELKMPVVIVTGADDRVVESSQSQKLHRQIAHSTLRWIPRGGHMVHQTATAEVLSAIDLADQHPPARVATS